MRFRDESRPWLSSVKQILEMLVTVLTFVIVLTHADIILLIIINQMIIHFEKDY